MAGINDQFFENAVIEEENRLEREEPDFMRRDGFGFDRGVWWAFHWLDEHGYVQRPVRLAG